MKDKVYIVAEKGKPIAGSPYIFATLEGAKTELRSMKYDYPLLDLEIRTLTFFKKNPKPFSYEDWEMYFD